MPAKRLLLIPLALLLLNLQQSNAAEFSLNVTAADSSAFYEYFSDGFARIDQRDPPPNDFRQRFHAISNPSISYGPLDVFPHDGQMRFGSLDYDDTTLIAGTGTTAITGLTLGFLTDPFDPTYLNWQRFAGSTIVNSYSGTISLVNGFVSSIDLDVSVTLHFPSYLGATIPGDYTGDFKIESNNFSLYVDDTDFIDPVFAPAGTDFHLAWDWSGTVNGIVPAIPGDLNGDGFVGQDDLNLILGSWGSEVASGSEPDPSHDGFVGQDDLNIVLGAWGTGTPPQAIFTAVPEFSSFMLIPAFMGCVVVARRFRRS